MRKISVTTAVVFMLFTVSSDAKTTMPGTKEFDLSKQVDLKKYKHKYQLSMSKPLAFGKISCAKRKVAVGAKFELSFVLNASYTNPFNPEDITVDAHITQPDGKQISYPAFFYSEFTYDPKSKLLTDKRGASCWKVRYSPRLNGNYSIKLVARNKSGVKSIDAGSFAAVKSNWQGQIQVAKKNPFALEYSKGAAYYPLGPNVPIWGSSNKEYHREILGVFLDELKRLSSAGANYIRLRADSYFQAIELPFFPQSGFLGIGYYNQARCFEIDKIYEACENYNIQLQHCMYNENSLAVENSMKWAEIYNLALKVNGGFCDKPADFWTNKELKKYIRRRMRYQLARWGYSPSLMAWEFFNEVGNMADPKVKSWLIEMGSYLRKLDPYGHLITNSGDLEKASAATWNIPQLDIVQTHLYNAADNVLKIKALCSYERGFLKKPYLLGEWGISSKKTNRLLQEKDAQGVSIHNAIWSMAMNGGCGISSWYARGLNKYNLYRHYTTFAVWSKDVPWNMPHKQLLVTNIKAKPRSGQRSDVLIAGTYVKKFEKSEKSEFTVNAQTGKVSNIKYLQDCLHTKPARKTTPVFLLDGPKECTFEVLLKTSIGDKSNALKIYIDDVLVIKHPLPATGKPNKYGNMTVNYEPPVKVSVKVPAGKHKVKVEAVGKDRLDFVNYLIRNYSRTQLANAFGFAANGNAYLWLHNTSSVSNAVIAGTEVQTIEKLSFTLSGLNDGKYLIKWYDPWKDKNSSGGYATCKNGQMKINAPNFKHDIALKVLQISRK
jgi:Domain of unknown function (DUF5060)